MRNLQKGFTLVELAIVLMIIGLLIGGILKGQELIANARIISFVSQARSVSTALITFQDIYGALPGDITNPGTRLPNCTTAPCNTAGNGNALINWPETNTVILHLERSNLLGGLTFKPISIYPTTPLGGYFTLFTSSSSLPAEPAGHRIVYFGDPTWSLATDFLTASQSAKIDRKMDDGIPGTGSVRASEGYDEAEEPRACVIGNGYAESDNSSLCDVFIVL
jgi:prepilin-type N-terminal cleavage/methylation domain-containing protein